MRTLPTQYPTPRSKRVKKGERCLLPTLGRKGKVVSVTEHMALVEWDDGATSNINITHLRREQRANG